MPRLESGPRERPAFWVTTVSLKAHDFGLFGSDKTIALGNLPPAPPPPPAPVAKTGGLGSKPSAAAGAAKAKAAPPKK